MDKGTIQVSTPLVTGGALCTSGGGGGGGSGSTAGGGTGSTAGGGTGSTAGGGTTSTAGGGTGLDSGNGAWISVSPEPLLLLEEPDAKIRGDGIEATAVHNSSFLRHRLLMMCLDHLLNP